MRGLPLACTMAPQASIPLAGIHVPCRSQEIAATSTVPDSALNVSAVVLLQAGFPSSSQCVQTMPSNFLRNGGCKRRTTCPVSRRHVKPPDWLNNRYFFDAQIGCSTLCLVSFSRVAALEEPVAHVCMHAGRHACVQYVSKHACINMVRVSGHMMDRFLMT